MIFVGCQTGFELIKILSAMSVGWLLNASTTLAEVLEAVLPDGIRSWGNGVVALATGGQ